MARDDGKRGVADEGIKAPSAPWQCAPYDAVAQVYDRLMAEVFEFRQQPLLTKTMSAYGLKRGVWADVACGTGTVARHLVRSGWRVYGFDKSEAMLAVARGKFDSRAYNPTLAREDMRHFVAPETCDVVSCLFDSVNIMTRKADLRQTFRAAARALKPGGYYLFDSVTPYHTRHLWDCCDQIHEGDGFFGVWEVERVAPNNTASVLMRWFIRRDDPPGDGLFVRADETHHIRGYTREETTQALAAAGLEVVAAYDGDMGFMAPVTAQTPRIDFVARKI